MKWSYKVDAFALPQKETKNQKKKQFSLPKHPNDQGPLKLLKDHE